MVSFRHCFRWDSPRSKLSNKELDGSSLIERWYQETVNRGVRKWDSKGKAVNKGTISISCQWVVRAQSHRGTLEANEEHVPVLPLSPQTSAQWERNWVGCLYTYSSRSSVEGQVGMMGGYPLADTNRTIFTPWRKPSDRDMWIPATESTEVVSPEQWTICPVSTEASACPFRKETPPYPWLSYLSWLKWK